MLLLDAYEQTGESKYLEMASAAPDLFWMNFIGQVKNP